MAKRGSREGAGASSAGAGAPVRLLSGGNPQIRKGDGDAPVQAYIAALPGWKHEVGRQLDDLVAAVVPGAQRAVRWNSPFYGSEGLGWFVSMHALTRCMRVTFLNGATLRPPPPGGGKDPDARWCDVGEEGIDEAQMADWLRQAAALPGWRGF